MRAWLFCSMLIPMFPFTARADNGVERGDVSVNGSASIPKGLEDRLETLIFGNCDLRGAAAINISYLKVSGDDAGDFQLQYSVVFSDGGPPALISVHALLGTEGGVQLLNLSSPICKTLP
jgi:hypothetical protein